MRPANEIKDGARLLALANVYRRLLIPSPEVLADTVMVLHRLVLLSDKVLALKAYFNVVQDIQRGRLDQGGQRKECSEDVFMAACAFLQVEIAKQGSVYYLKGESPDFKETKKNRNPLDLTNEITLKTVSSALARPDEERGSVEIGQIVSNGNHLTKLVNLYSLLPKVVAMHKDDEKNRKVDVRKAFGLSHTDYERLMAIARREGQISFRNRQKDPKNNYELKQKNHERVVAYAERFGFTPQKTLNNILDDFFAVVEKGQGKR
jgi:hypothetical protein